MTTRNTIRARRAGGPVAATVLSWLYALLLALPLYYLAVSALKTNIEIFTRPFALPSHWLWANFATAWRTAGLGQALLNSLLISVVAIVLTLGLAVPAAYALARQDNRLARAVTGAFSAGFLIPPFAALIPTVILAIRMGLFYTREFQMLFLPASALPLSVLLLTQFMRTVPRALVESAALDGAGHWRLLVSVFIPIAMPGVVSVTILQLLTFWNEYLFSLTITGTGPDVRTVQVALPTLVSDVTNLGVLTAGTVLTLLPVYLAYSLSSRRMQEALTAGAVKG
jgi:multiple sugar transport system permease protein